MNWYKKAQIEYKEPWQMTQEEFVKYHITGSISSSAYNQYKTTEGLNWLKKEDYPILYDTKQFNGVTVEFRKTGEPLRYTKRDEKDNIVRDEKGMATYLSKEEMINKNLPTEDQGLVAFIGDTAVGLASNEFGATGIWVVEDYQKMGIGSYLLREFRKTMSPKSRLGQATGQGVALTRKYHKQLVQEALEEGKPVSQEVLEDYPDLTGGAYDIDYWKKRIIKSPVRYYDVPENIQQSPEMQDFMINLYVELLKRDPSWYVALQNKFKNSPKIQNFVKLNPRRYGI